MKRNKNLSDPRAQRVHRQPSTSGSTKPYRNYFVLALAIAVLTFVGFSQLSKADAQNTRARFQQDLAQTFTSYEQLSVDPGSVAEQVRAFGRVSLISTAHDFELELQPSDLRGPNYRAEQTDADGVVRATAMPGVTTFKGHVEGVATSDARFTIDGQKIEGMIITPGQSYFVESAQKYSAAAAATDYLLYTAEDVRSDITRSCGDTLEQQVNAGAKQMMTSATSGATPAVFSPLKIVELATESDLEYTNALGGASQANSDILSIMNSINAIYERDIGLTFTVTY